MLATKNIRQVRRFIAAARIEILFDARGPKCFVMMSIHIKDNHEIKIPPSSAIQSSCKSVLFASKFIQITLTTNNVTTVAGIDLKSILISVLMSVNLFFKTLTPNLFYIINLIFCNSHKILFNIIYQS